MRARLRTAGPAGMDHTDTHAVPTPAAASHPIALGRLALSYGEAARAVGCSPRTIWAACASGDLRAARVGRRRLIPREELVRWINAKAGIAETPVVEAKGGAR